MEQARVAGAVVGAPPIRPMEHALPERYVVRPVAFDENAYLELKNSVQRDKIHFTLVLMLFTFSWCVFVFWLMMLTGIAFSYVGYFIAK